MVTLAPSATELFLVLYEIDREPSIGIHDFRIHEGERPTYLFRYSINVVSPSQTARHDMDASDAALTAHFLRTTRELTNSS